VDGQKCSQKWLSCWPLFESYTNTTETLTFFIFQHTYKTIGDGTPDRLLFSNIKSGAEAMWHGRCVVNTGCKWFWPQSQTKHCVLCSLLTQHFHKTSKHTLWAFFIRPNTLSNISLSMTTGQSMWSLLWIMWMGLHQLLIRVLRISAVSVIPPMSHPRSFTYTTVKCSYTLTTSLNSKHLLQWRLNFISNMCYCVVDTTR